MLPMEDPPACLEFQVAHQRLQQQAPAAMIHLCDDDSFQELLSSFEDWLNTDLAKQ